MSGCLCDRARVTPIDLLVLLCSFVGFENGFHLCGRRGLLLFFRLVCVVLVDMMRHANKTVFELQAKIRRRDIEDSRVVGERLRKPGRPALVAGAQ